MGAVGVVVVAIVAGGRGRRGPARPGRRRAAKSTAAMAVHLLTGDDESLLLSRGRRPRAPPRRRRRPLADGRRVRRRRRTSCAPSSTRRRRRRSSPTAGSWSPATSGGSAPTTARRSSRYLADPLDTTDWCSVAGGGRLPKALDRRGRRRPGRGHIDTAPPSRARDRRRGWSRRQADAGRAARSAAPPARSPSTSARTPAALDGILRTLAADLRRGHAAAATSSRAVPRRGRRRAAVGSHRCHRRRRHRRRRCTLLARMIGAGERHPLQVMAILHSHYAKLPPSTALDARNEATAAAAMGIKPGFPAARRWISTARLGRAAVSCGRSGCWPRPTSTCAARRMPDEELVMEVLVARLSRLADALSGVEPGQTSAAGGVDLLHQAALAPGRLVLVDDALGGRLVEALHGEAHARRRSSVPMRARRPFLTRVFSSLLHGLVALGALGVGEDCASSGS